MNKIILILICKSLHPSNQAWVWLCRHMRPKFPLMLMGVRVEGRACTYPVERTPFAWVEIYRYFKNCWISQKSFSFYMLAYNNCLTITIFHSSTSLDSRPTKINRIQFNLEEVQRNFACRISIISIWYYGWSKIHLLQCCNCINYIEALAHLGKLLHKFACVFLLQ